MKKNHILHSADKEAFEKAIQKEQQRFTELFIKVPALIAVLKGDDFVYEMANPRYLELIGKEDIVGKKLADVMPELESQGFIKSLTNVYQTGKSYSVSETPVKINRDGNGTLTEVYLNLIYQPFRNYEGAIEGVFFFANDVTAQVQARRRLVESEKRYRQIVETTQEGIWMIDKNNLTTFANKQFCDLLEYTPEEVIGKPNTFFMDNYGRDIAEKAAKNRILGTKEKLDLPLVTKSGKRVWVNLSGTTIIDEHGNYNGGLAMVSDITDRKLAEEKIVQSEERFRALIENSHDAIIMYDKDLVTIYRSPSASRMMGYNDHEKLDKKLSAEIHKDDVEKMENHISEVLSNPGKALSFLVRTRHKAGNYIWIEGVTTNLLQNKNVNAIVSNLRDITERKLAEEALQFSEQRFKSLIENSEDILSLIDTSGKLTYVSPSLERILGYTNEETKGHSPIEIIHPDDVQIAIDCLQEALENPGKPIALEARNRRKDGEFIWLSGTITNMLHIPGVNAVVANTRDVTQHKAAEDISRQNEALLAKAQRIAKYGNWNLDVTTGKLTWSDELYNVFGIEKEKFAQTFESFIELIDEEDRSFVFEKSRSAKLTGQPFDIEYHITTSTGEKRIINEIGNAEYDRDGKMLRLFGTAQNITERKRAEEEIIKEKELSDSIINSLTGIFYLLDRDGNFLRWNKNAEIVSGYTANELAHLNARALFGETDKVIMGEKIAEVFSNGMAEAEAYLLTKDQKKIPYYFKANAADFEGQHCLIGIAIDITERRKAEAKIKESEAKFRAFFENSLDAILFSTIDGKILEANSVATEILGITETDIYKVKTSKLIDTSDDRLKQLSAELFLKGRSKGEVAMIRRDGTKIPCEVAAVIYRDGYKEQRVSIIIRDITERKSAEERLLQINERYKLAMRATSNAIWDWNLKTNEMFWSEGYELTFGYDLEEKPETCDNWLKKIHPSDVERVQSAILKVILGNDAIFWEDEYRFMKADGSVAYVYDRGNLVFDRDNNPVRFVGAMQDITLRKEVETERELLIKELMKTNADLRQFSYITSHNLRAPLSNIIAILDIIDYPALDKNNLELIEMLRVSAKQLSTTIDDLANILIIKNNINVEVVSIDVEDTLKTIEKTFIKDLENVEGIIVTHFEIHEVHFHKTYLESILVNLISNAIKYRSPNRRLVIHISTAKDEKGNCVLKFSDNGVGIDLKRHKDKVFGLYQRFHNEIEGHGLGLFIIKSQITALGGNIEIESEVDKGTTFTITFKKSQ